MLGTVRSVKSIADDDDIQGNEGHLVAVRWDDGTLSEDVWPLDRPVPSEDDRVERWDD